MNRLIVIVTFLFSFKGFSQDTLVLKITNMQAFYEPCMNHWTSCGTILYGKPSYGEDSEKSYRIHVLSTEILNRLHKNPTSIYHVIVRKRFYKDPFEQPGEEVFNLIAIF
jgi:hypothetical protein